MTAPTPPAARSPYRGIVPFRYADRADFFGRDRQINDLTAKIVLFRLVVLFGESGAGKSSLLNAGVIPRLIDEGFGPERLYVRPFDADPILVERIGSGDGKGGYLPSIFAPEQEERDAPLQRYARSIAEMESSIGRADPARPPVLIFDQFEELFTLFESSRLVLQRNILDFIFRIIEGRVVNADAVPIRVKVVIGIREDFLGKLELLAQRYPQILDRRVRLGQLSAADATCAILGPFGHACRPALSGASSTPSSDRRPHRFKSEFTPGLALAIVDGFEKDDAGAIHSTQLQIVCSQLWDRFSLDAAAPGSAAAAGTGNRTPTIDEEHFKRLGSMQGILHGFLDSELEKLTADERAEAFSVLGALVTKGGTRDVVSEERLKEAVGGKIAAGGAPLRTILALLEQRKLIHRTPQHGSYYYEIASEYLVAPIREHNVTREREKARSQALSRLWIVGIVGVALAVGVFTWQQMRQKTILRERLLDFMAVSQENSGHAAEGLAYLARALQVNPSSAAVRSHILNELLYRNWPLPVAHVKHGGAVSWSEFSRDSTRILTVSDRSVRVWSVPDGQPIGVTIEHETPVLLARFTPKADQVLTLSGDGLARLWDVASGNTVRTFQSPDSNGGSRISWVTLSRDGSRIGTGATDGSLRIWTAASGVVPKAVQAHDAQINSVQFSPDGTRLVTASADQTARIWNVASGTAVAQLKGHEGVVYSAQFSADGQRVITASNDRTARIWSAARTAPELMKLPHENAVTRAEFGPDDRVIVTISRDGPARLWEAVSGRLIGHAEPIVSAAFAPDGDRLVTASGDRSARVWSVETGHLAAEPMRHAAALESAQFSANGRYIVTSSDDGTARIWDSRPGAALPETLHVHHDRVKSAQFSPDARRVVAATNTGVLIWDTGNPGEAARKIAAAEVNWAEFSPDGRWILSFEEQEAHAWDAATLASVGGPMRHDQGDIVAAHFSPNGQFVVTASRDHLARIWNAATGARVQELRGHEESLWAAEFSPDGTRVVTAARDGTARLWDAASGRQLQKYAHEGEVFVARFSPDGRRIVTASADRTARVWSIDGGAPLLTLGHLDKVVQARFNATGTQIVTGSEDRTARVWDASSGLTISADMAHTGPVDTVAFSPDSLRVATTSRDGALRLWDARTEISISPPLRHFDAVYTLRFDPARPRVLTASADGHVRLWTLPVGTDTDNATLIDLAFAIGGYRLNASDATLPAADQDADLNRLRSSLGAPHGKPGESVAGIAQWLLGDRSTRTISPFSSLTVDDFLNTLLKDPDDAGAQREAARAFPGDPRIPRRLAAPPER